MRVYLSGKMTGIENFNKEAFALAAKRWREAGYDVLNPHEFGGEDQTKDWHHYMRQDLYLIMNVCDGIALLRDWSDSRGARVELLIARIFGLKIYDAHTMKEMSPRMSICQDGARELEIDEAFPVESRS